MPPQLEESIRRAIAAGGGHFRISPGPFIYLDKNYVQMLDGIRGLYLQQLDSFK
ncbi:MAG: hypothetical protein PHP28_02605 [Actinomycetota bacterium]|nr:hypothetical protein [Actinomycetota bacterium]MDD5666648.1 hypothetical protein [Actinomycetota bacterium]